VHEELKYAGYEGFGFFSFAPVGLAVLAVAVIYILLVGRRLLPGEVRESTDGKDGRSIEELWEDFRVDRRYESVQITPDSPLAGRPIADTELESRYRVRILGIMRQNSGGEERIASPAPDTELKAGDTLLIVGLASDNERLTAENALTPYAASKQHRQRWLWELGAVAVLIHPESRFIGKTLRELEYRTRYGLHVFGIRRNRKPLPDYKDVKLAASDSLLVVGPWSRIQQMSSQHLDFVVLRCRVSALKWYQPIGVCRSR